MTDPACPFCGAGYSIGRDSDGSVIASADHDRDCWMFEVEASVSFFDEDCDGDAEALVRRMLARRVE